MFDPPDRLYCHFQAHLWGCVLVVNMMRFQESYLTFGWESFVLTCHTVRIFQLPFTHLYDSTDIFDSADWYSLYLLYNSYSAQELIWLTGSAPTIFSWQTWNKVSSLFPVAMIKYSPECLLSRQAHFFKPLLLKNTCGTIKLDPTTETESFCVKVIKDTDWSPKLVWTSDIKSGI